MVMYAKVLPSKLRQGIITFGISVSVCPLTDIVLISHMNWICLPGRKLLYKSGYEEYFELLY